MRYKCRVQSHAQRQAPVVLPLYQSVSSNVARGAGELLPASPLQPVARSLRQENRLSYTHRARKHRSHKEEFRCGDAQEQHQEIKYPDNTAPVLIRELPSLLLLQRRRCQRGLTAQLLSLHKRNSIKGLQRESNSSYTSFVPFIYFLLQNRG